MTRVLGAVLAGGQSRRFGSDKALAALDGRALLDHVIDALETQTDAILICGRTVAGRNCVPDRPGGGLGPLSGLNAALHYAALHGFDLVATAPCDTPLLPTDLVERLQTSGAPSYLADAPVIGLWPIGDAGALDQHLAQQDDRSMRQWAQKIGAQPLLLPPIANINSPVDLTALAGSNQQMSGKAWRARNDSNVRPSDS